MINLLSDVKKREIRAARSNTILSRYITLLVCALIFIGGVIFVSYQTLHLSDQSATAQLELSGDGSLPDQADSNEQLASSIRTYRAQNPNTTDLLLAFSRSLPGYAVIQTLDLTPTALQGSPFKVTVYLKSGSKPDDVISALQSSGIAQSVTAGKILSSKTVPGYPSAVDLTLSLNTAAQRGPQL